MRFWFVPFLVLAFVSCKTEVDLVGDYEVRPIIYGLLDQSDSIHYIKIQKTFSGQGNALDMAQVPDSVYFDDVFATITETLQNGTTGRVWVLQDTLVENKDIDGVFFAPEQKLYYFSTPTIQNDPVNSLQPGATYALEVNINDGQFIITASTELVSGISLTTPNLNAGLIFRGPTQGDYKAQSFLWTRGNGEIFNFSLEFHYDEVDLNNTSTTKSFTMTYTDVLATSGTNVSNPVSGEGFYQAVGNRVPVDANVSKRVPNFFIINIIAGSEELRKYIAANKPSSTLAQNKPQYTNLEGGALGLFSARHKVRIQHFFIIPITNARGLNRPSTQELCEGQYTNNLNFCSNHPADAQQPGGSLPYSYYCQ